MVELERGSTDTKLWKDVKRKRVRIPDLVCVRCGQRAESRAKTNAELAMSHSITDEARAWDFGMIDSDLIGFPICQAVEERYWSAGKLNNSGSYWHERNWVRWRLAGKINYFRVGAFRGTKFSKSSVKGVTEGSETSICWDAVFAGRAGTVEDCEGNRITIRRESDGHRQTRNVPANLRLLVTTGDHIDVNQVIASALTPISDAALACAGTLPTHHVADLLGSRERTQRFTGIKLARLRGDGDHYDAIAELAADKEEDIYVRLEGLSYLAAVCGRAPEEIFSGHLDNPDPQTQLESVIAIGEVNTPEAVDVLSGILNDSTPPYFLRSAAAWSLGRIGTEAAISRLVKGFADIDIGIREEALEGIASLGGAAVPILLSGLRGTAMDVAAGCAEALRQQASLPDDAISKLSEGIREANASDWAVWLLGQLPRERVAPAIVGLQTSAPQLYYAISLLWSFMESWIARRWEVYPGPVSPESGQTHGA
jgi:HEAT repeat protein